MLNKIISTTEKTPIEVLLKIDSEGYTTAKKLYEFLELDISNYSRWCKQNIIDNQFAEKKIDYISFYSDDNNSSSMTSLTGRGNYKDFKLSASFAKKLAMQTRTEKGEQARAYFVACEQALVRIAKEKQQWEIERAKGVMIRHILTDTIKMKISESPNKRFAYPNYTRLIYKLIFDKNYKELCEYYGVKAKESLRDYLTADQLKEVENVEMMVSSLIALGMGYEEIKGFLTEKYTRQAGLLSA